MPGMKTETETETETEVFYLVILTLCLPYIQTQAILLTTLDNYICSK